MTYHSRFTPPRPRPVQRGKAIAPHQKTFFSGVFSGCVLLLLLVAAWFILTPTASADQTPDCGGHQQQKCEFAPAKKEGSPATKLCKKGFFDPRKGGECWSCPSGYNRTVFAVHGKTACQKKGSVVGGYQAATYHAKSQKLGCGKGEIRDLGKCWTCPAGYNRSVHPINGSLACTVKADLTCDKGLKVRSDARCYDPTKEIERKTVQSCGGLYELKCEFAHAKFVGRPTGMGCKNGGFFDPRKGGQCWSCPAGYNRSLHSVTGHLACTAKAENTCEPGLRPDFGNICQYSKAAEIEALARQKINQYAISIAKTVLLAADIQAADGIVAKVDKKNNAATSQIHSQNNYDSATQSAEKDGFKTLSIGVIGSGNLAVIGSTGEHGLAFDISGQDKVVKWYSSIDYKLGPALSIDSGANISLWTAENDVLFGDAHGFVLGVADAVKALKAVAASEKILSAAPGLSVAVTAWFDYDQNFIGISVTPTVSVGADFGGYVRATTVQAK